jgi:hypothetical protein
MLIYFVIFLMKILIILSNISLKLVKVPIILYKLGATGLVFLYTFVRKLNIC